MIRGRGIVFCIGVFLAARLALSMLGWLGVRDVSLPEGGRDIDGVPTIVVPGLGREVPATPGFHNVVDGTARWDAFWYLSIAGDGYVDPSVAAFFPGYPAVVAVVDEITPIGSLGAAVLVSNLAFLLALIALYRLTSREFDDAVAKRSIVILASFPTSFFFLAPYPESLYLLFAVLTFSAARSDRWATSGAWGALAWATRSMGAVLVPSLLVEAWRQGRWSARLAWSMAPAMGLLAYIAWWWLDSGDPTAPIGAQSSWYRELAFPLVSLGRGVAIGMRGLSDTLWLPEAGEALVTVVTVLLLVTYGRRLPSPSYTAYVTLGYLIPLTFTIPARPLLSLPRFVIVLFPLAWLGALWAEGSLRFAVLIAVFVIAWITLSVAFMNWRFIA